MKEINYNRYMQAYSTPAGAVLKRILETKGLKHNDLAESLGLLPQRICDLINGRRRFTPQLSHNLEKALSIDIDGFFYLIQARHDMHLFQLESQKKPDLSKFSKSTFWDINVDSIDWAKAKSQIIRRVLEYGTNQEMSEICRFYGKEAIVNEANDLESFRLKNVVEKKLQKIDGIA